MAKLKPCKTCGKEVAKSAKKCPHCGQKLKMGFMMKAIIGIAALVVISIIASLNGGGGNSAKPASTAATNTSTSNQKAAEPAKKKAAEPAKQEAPKQLSNEGVSSDVAIKVVGMESASEISTEFSKETAQGVFKIITLSLTNNQKDAITVDADSFKLVDDKGREFSYSTNGQTQQEMKDNTSSNNFFLKSLNPGLTQQGKIVFDIPADATGLVLKARGGMTGDEITLKVQ